MTDRGMPPDAFRRAFDAAPLPMALLDDAGAVVAANQALAAIRGHDVVAIAGRELLGTDDSAEGSAALIDQLRSGVLPVAHVRGRLAAADGATDEVAIVVRLLDGEPSLLLACVEDVARHPATGTLPSHDAVTGLVSVAVFADLLHLLVADDEATGDGGLAVLYAAATDVGALRTSYGPAIGDYLLVQVARRLAGLLRAGDTAARYGEGEFVVVGMADDAAAAQAMRERVARELSAPYELADRALPVPLTVGLAFVPEGERRPSADAMLSTAEADARSRAAG